MVTESQLRQALNVVLRDMAQAIVQALPQQSKENLVEFQTGIEMGRQLPDGRLLLKIADAAAMLSISKAALYRLVQDGRLRTIRVGKSRRIPVSVLQEFITRELGESI
jgi:excisionase family DNA binding protein